jgi:hypothetical protein
MSVTKGTVLGPLLYLLYTAGLPTSPESITATFADDTAILATESDLSIASHKLQTSVYVTFTTGKEMCPLVHINNVQLPQMMMPSILGCTLTEDLPSTYTFS